MNRNSHLALLSMPQGEVEGDKENGIFSQALNTRNQARQSQEMRAPFGQIDIQDGDNTEKPKLKKRDSKIDPTVVIKVKSVR